MFRFILKLALIVTIIFAVTGFVARAFGGTQPPNAALRGFIEGCEDKAQPCWYGIVPGKTTLETAQKQIEFAGYEFYDTQSNFLYYSNRGVQRSKPQPCSNIMLVIDEAKPIVSVVYFRGCENITLGELSFLGFPEKMLQGDNLFIQMGKYSAVRTYQYGFANGYYYRKEWSPNSDVNELEIGSFTTGVHIAIEIAGFKWRGFMPHWRFCQLEPSSMDCA